MGFWICLLVCNKIQNYSTFVKKRPSRLRQGTKSISEIRLIWGQRSSIQNGGSEWDFGIAY